MILFRMKTKLTKSENESNYRSNYAVVDGRDIAIDGGGPNGGGGPEGGPFSGRIPGIIDGITIPGSGGGGTPGMIGSRAPAGSAGTPGNREPGGKGGGGGRRVPGGLGAAANAFDNALLALKAAAINQR